MLKTERKQLILEQLNQHQVVSLEKLVSLLETSESTVRRDLDEFGSREQASSCAWWSGIASLLAGRRNHSRKICQKPSREEVVGSESSLSHQGTRCHLYRCWNNNCFLIHELVNKNITVVTNSIHHAAQLVEKQIPTVMVGGSVKMATDASIGGVCS